MIKINNVSHSINDKNILDNINLELPSKQVIALIGPNGAGKSTLFSLMARLQPLQQGTICFGTHDIVKTNANMMAKTVAMLSQENHIQGRLRVHELLMFGRYPHHQGQPSDQDKKIVAKIIESFELQAIAERFLSDLSGGQKQRVLIAMVVCQDTPYVLLDEPLNNLDMYHAGQLMRQLRDLAHQRDKTIVIVLHDINQASQFADTIVMMKNGKIISQGKPIDTLTQQNIASLYGVSVDILLHQHKPVIVDAV